LSELYGYDHPPRAVRGVRVNGIPLETFSVTSTKTGRKIAAYRLVERSQIVAGRVGGRKAFSKQFKERLIEKYGRRATGSAFTSGCFEACTAFTRVAACLLAEPPRAARCLEGFDGLVTSTAAPIATGWSDQLSGRESHPLEIRALARRTAIGSPSRKAIQRANSAECPRSTLPRPPSISVGSSRGKTPG
jgi:hypothetical protein